ncbi:MAG: amidohydrolase family protein [Planctomycetota bacterium]
MIIRHATILTMTDRETFVGDLRVSDGRIVEIAPHVAHVGAGEEEIDATGCFLLPGFVQPHVHLCQTLFRGAADDLELLDWLAGRIWPMEAWLDESAMRAAADLGIYELIAGGTTAILDMGTRRHTSVLFERAAAAGLRYTGGKCLMDRDRSGRMPAALLEDVDSALGECRELIASFHETAGGLLRASLAPRFAVSCSDEMLSGACDLAFEHGLIFHSHASESRAECELVRAATGRNNIDYLSELGVLGSQTVLAHGIHLFEGELDLLFGTGTHVVHCPSSNLKLASGVCAVPEMLDYGVNVALAADGAACNNRLSMFREMILAALIHKPRVGPTGMDAWRVLEMATVNGARALGLEDEIGTLEVGKCADLVVIDPRRPETLGLGDAAARIVYACDEGSVRDVFIDGRAVKRDGVVRPLGADEVAGAASEAWERLRRDFTGLDGGTAT